MVCVCVCVMVYGVCVCCYCYGSFPLEVSQRECSLYLNSVQCAEV